MQTISHLRSAIPTEQTVFGRSESAPSRPSYAWQRAGAAAAAATVLLAACGGQEHVYTTADLASAPHNAQVRLGAGTVLAFEAFEGAECDKKGAMNVYAGSVVLAAPATPRPRASKTVKPSASPKSVPSNCEGAEVQAEACQIGATADTSPDTAANNCAHVDFNPAAFSQATGLQELEDNQQVTLVTPLGGIVDRD